MEEGYRIPLKQEFVQGFEFEVVDWTQPTGMMAPDGNGGFKHISFGAPKEWKPMKVTWMADPNSVITTKHGDLTIHTKGSVNNFFVPFNVEAFIQQRLVRVKI